MKRIYEYKVFDDYLNKIYKVVTRHKVFGTQGMKVAISGFVDDENRIGIIVHGHELWCDKNSKDFRIVEKCDGLCISDSMLEIFIKI